MNTSILTATAFVVAAVSSVCLVASVPAVGIAAIHGRRRGILHATTFALLMAVLAFVAFTVLGAGAAIVGV